MNVEYNDGIIWSADMELTKSIFKNIDMARVSRTQNVDAAMSLRFYQFASNTIISQMKSIDEDKYNDYIEEMNDLIEEGLSLVNIKKVRNHRMYEKRKSINQQKIADILSKIDQKTSDGIFMIDLGFKKKKTLNPREAIRGNFR